MSIPVSAPATARGLSAIGSAACLVAMAAIVLTTSAGCNRGGKMTGDEVVEIESIERLPPDDPVPAKPTADTKPTTTVAATDTAPAVKPDLAPAGTAQPAAPQADTTDTGPLKPAAAPPAAAAEPVMLGDPTLTAGIPGSGMISLDQVDAWLAEPRNHVVLAPLLPVGLAPGKSQIQGLDKNPLTRAKIELGRQLYFDTRLSANSTVSCASCHNPDTGYTAHTPTGVGIDGQKGGRNSPVSFNRILSGAQFWDGRADSLEAQAIGPIANPIEMGFTHEGVVQRLREIPVYRRQFDKVFGELTIGRVGEAIAAFERVLVTGPSPYDHGEEWRRMEAIDADDLAEDADLAKRHAAAKAAAAAQPLSEAAVRGREIFFGAKGNCSACHVGANLADEKYHNIGVGMHKSLPDPGRFAVTKDQQDTGAFKTPTVRNVALTAPYMHDGSLATLEEVVEWYAKGGHPNPFLSEKIKPLSLTAQEKADLVAFMQACTGPTPPVETGRLPE